MANGIRTGDPRGPNKGCSLKFCDGSRVQKTQEESQRTYQPKRCGNNNKDEDSSPKILNEKIFFKTCQSVMSMQRAFHAHFIPHWNDAVLYRIFDPQQYLFYIWNSVIPT